jgi:hypothetical protein
MSEGSWVGLDVHARSVVAGVILEVGQKVAVSECLGHARLG